MTSTTQVNPLPGVPAIESPFFDEVFTAERFTETELRIARDLRDNGFAVFDFPDAELDARIDRIKAALHDKYPWEQWHAGATGLRLMDAWKWNRDVRAIAANNSILELLGKLYGRRAWPFQTLNFPVGTQQHYHTDSIHFSSVPERFMCGVWLAMEDIGPEQGPLEYFPGSHRWPIYTNEHVRFVPRGLRMDDQTPYQELWERLVAKTGAQRTEFHARKGQALIWAANLLHGGAPHHDKSRTRWSQVTHYYFDDCAYYTPMHSDPFRGKIEFRFLTDVSTLKRMRNSFSGEPIPRTFLLGARTGFAPLNALRLVYRKVVRTISRIRG